VNEPVPAVEPSIETVELSIPARAEWVVVARLAVAAAASRLAFTVEEIEDIKLALAEACTFCIQHGPGGERIDVKFEALHDAMTMSVSIADASGAITEVVTPDELAVEEQAEEIGIFLLRALMDDVDYRADRRTGLTLSMTKRIEG
jgi:serine/threonine-protein kinase RsbW